MPNWPQAQREIREQKDKRIDALDYVRRDYLSKLGVSTGRNVVAYYSGWLQKKDFQGSEINDNDMNGFTLTIQDLDPAKGLDLILHTPGGNMAATEAIVNYLHLVFGEDIRAIIPQIAMSAGTMMACACKEIVMGQHSSLGPIDPQFGGVPASGVIEEFKKAQEEVKKDPSSALLWRSIISKYHPTFIGECEKAMEWAEDIVGEWLRGHMFLGKSDCETLAEGVVTRLSDHDRHKNHSRHINIQQCEEMHLEIKSFEDEIELKELVMTIHQIYMYTFSQTAALKIIENNLGRAQIYNLSHSNIG